MYYVLWEVRGQRKWSGPYTHEGVTWGFARTILAMNPHISNVKVIGPAKETAITTPAEGWREDKNIPRFGSEET